MSFPAITQNWTSNLLTVAIHLHLQLPLTIPKLHRCLSVYNMEKIGETVFIYMVIK